MKAQLRRLHSPDVQDLRNHVPEDPACFGIFIQAMLGPEGGVGEESFGFTACTPAWLKKELDNEQVRWGRATLLVTHYDYTLLRQAVEAICDRARADDWTELGESLALFMDWEFQGYRETHS